MTEEEAKRVAIKDTDYCYVIATAWEGEPNESVCLERIFVKGGREEIRLAWWTNRNQAMRPADIDAVNWASTVGFPSPTIPNRSDNSVKPTCRIWEHSRFTI